MEKINLIKEFENLLIFLTQNSWSIVFQVHGWDLTANSSQSQLTINRDAPGIEDFALEGIRAIEPGDPARSLLFHALLSPGVVEDAIIAWPSLQQIDLLENYIYSLKPLSKQILSSLTPVVMAYEYRSASTVPHGKHADFVYSRLGIGRVGTIAHEYDSKKRCFVTNFDQNLQETRVLPAKYAVFLCTTQSYGSGISIQGHKHSGDSSRQFYCPVHKLFAGDACIDGLNIELNYAQCHENEKLRRMVTHGKLKLTGEFDINHPPFYYHSDDDNFVSTEVIGSSLLVARRPQDLVRTARQNETVVTYNVPPETAPWLKRFIPYNNRRYSSLRVGQRLFLVALDYALNYLLEKVGSDKRMFLSPRQSGEFTNMRHLVNEKGEIYDINALPKEEFDQKIKEGNFSAIMYEDPLSEGVVSCQIKGLNQTTLDAKPAWSLMTAPDFMPKAGNIDLYGFKANFVIGGPQALCEGRLAVNPRLYFPGIPVSAFAQSEHTITSVISLPRTEAKTVNTQPHYDVTHYFSDYASDIFAPGWEVTYNRDSLFSYPYYHTSGLGSPFLEDVKLCASANGMWPAASPDAARTFKSKTRTAIPLTDEELGFAPNSPLVLRGQKAVAGWDGECGPYLLPAENGWQVNYTEILRSDYVSNGLNKQVRFNLLRLLSKDELTERMTILALSNQKLLGDIKLSDSPYWLIVFQKIADWTQTQELNVPNGLMNTVKKLQQLDDTNLPGYFMVFGRYSEPARASKDNIKRNNQVLSSIILVKARVDHPVVSYEWSVSD